MRCKPELGRQRLVRKPLSAEAQLQQTQSSLTCSVQWGRRKGNRQDQKSGRAHSLNLRQRGMDYILWALGQKLPWALGLYIGHQLVRKNLVGNTS